MQLPANGHRRVNSSGQSTITYDHSTMGVQSGHDRGAANLPWGPIRAPDQQCDQGAIGADLAPSDDAQLRASCDQLLPDFPGAAGQHVPQDQRCRFHSNFRDAVERLGERGTAVSGRGR
jgi:hypothetical protein